MECRSCNNRKLVERDNEKWEGLGVWLLYLFPSTTSMRSSAVASQRSVMSAL